MLNNKVIIELDDVNNYMDSGLPFDEPVFYKLCKKEKFNIFSGAGWPVVALNDDLYVCSNCVIWVNNKHIPYISVTNNDKSINTIKLKKFQKLNNRSIFGVIWVDDVLKNNV